MNSKRKGDRVRVLGKQFNELCNDTRWRIIPRNHFAGTGAVAKPNTTVLPGLRDEETLPIPSRALEILSL